MILLLIKRGKQFSELMRRDMHDNSMKQSNLERCQARWNLQSEQRSHKRENVQLVRGKARENI